MRSVPMRIATACAFVLSVAGCISHQVTVPETRSDDTGPDAARGRARVSEQSRPLRESDSPYRAVVPGDTLYSIAWEAGRDYREIAAWNHIPRPYTIKPGQQLRVLPPAKSEKSSSAPVPSEPAGRRDAVPAKPEHKPSAVAKPTKPATARAHVPPPAAKPGQNAGGGKPVAKPADTGKSKRNDKLASARPGRGAPGTKSDKTASTGPGFWTWPADGRVLGRYSEGDAKGLDIVGMRGQPIRAAASGRVVYQGSGLRGYGQLIIIKHNDEFLSAYAHNDRIYVKEGDVVKRGQKIADMGSSGSDRVKLHFEIRRQGVPIDPLKYLPKR